MFSCLVDASKAFDKVHYCKLFNILIKRKLPCHVIRFLLDSYTRQKVCVSWDSSISGYFNTMNGVKQGGVLSPILCIVYIDELITRLQSSGIGCRVGNHYVGVLGYADDLTLLSPSVRSLNKILLICNNFADEFNITFNAKKTICIKFGNKVSEHDKVVLSGATIEWTNKVKHLGNMVNTTLSDDDDCKLKRSAFIGSVNKLFGNYGCLQCDILLKLLNKYCCSFYG